MTDADTKYQIAQFDASILPVLWPIVERRRSRDPLRLLDGEVFVEPCAAGGVMVGALCGVAMIVVRDPAGHASSAVTLSLPERVFEVCRRPEMVAMTYCGGDYRFAVPEWMQPGQVLAFTAGLSVMPRMNHPSLFGDDPEAWPVFFSQTAAVGNVYRDDIDYRLKRGLPADWRRPLRVAEQNGVRKDASFRNFDPRVVSLFNAAVDEAHHRDGGAILPTFTFCKHGDDERHGPVLVSLSNWPDFQGVFMPMEDGKVHLPDWWQKQISPSPSEARQ